MRVAFFDTHPFERECFDAANPSGGHEITYLEPRLTSLTALMARGFPAVCSFANDHVDAAALNVLKGGGVRLVALRSAGYNHIDLGAAKQAGIRVVRVPSYSPHSVAEHAVCLLLTLNRNVHRAHLRVREGNFSLSGLVGFDLYGKTVGVVGTGRIGAVFAKIMKGFGCRLLAFDISPSASLEKECEVKYVPLPELYAAADIISLHVPLNSATRHIIDENALAAMKRGVMLINTGRGALIDTKALIGALKSGRELDQWLAANRIDHLVIASTPGNIPVPLRELVGRGTTLLGSSGEVQVFRIKDEILFSHELLANPEFEPGVPGWAGVSLEPVKPGLARVTAAQPLQQTVPVSANQKYLLEVQADCDIETAPYRLQINWQGKDGMLAPTIEVRQCRPEAPPETMIVTAPSDAVAASIFATGHSPDQPVNLDRVSFRK